VPVPLGEKGPRIRDWQHLRINTPELAAQTFTFPMNIGGILGPASGGRVDVDLDCEEACRLADSFLPITRSVFGRASKPRSHRIYRINGPAPTCKFVDPINKNKDDKDTLLELRGTTLEGTSGLQTILPGSIHESGESIEWAENDEPAVVAYDDLKRSVSALAVAALLARYCPNAKTGEQALTALEQADPRIKVQIRRWRGVSQGQGAQPKETTPLPRRVAEGLGRVTDPRSLTLSATDIAEVWTALTFIDARVSELLAPSGLNFFGLPASNSIDQRSNISRRNCSGQATMSWSAPPILSQVSRGRSASYCSPISG
jgi:hypothetical protein